MRVFFLSELPCALHVAGVHLGLVDGFERSVELDQNANLSCQLIPFGDFLPVTFCIDDEFLVNPPPQIRLYYTENGVAIYACGFLRKDQSLRVLWQKRFDSTLLTLAVQGKLQLFFDSGDAKIIDLPSRLGHCSVERLADGFLLRGADAFALISLDGELVFQHEGNVISTENGIRAEIPFHDSMGHTAICEWTQGKLSSCSIRSAAPPTEATFALALFESALIGADTTPFLADNLLDKADCLRDYLGDFCSVVLTDCRNKIGLVYERKERVFDVRYFKVELHEQKICNISPL